MTYTEAVQKALEGDERGFGFLYENTYRSKLYLALQYMKNEEAAEDVLQEAYLRAFLNLKSLKDPERFSAWLGQIVANTAKNVLAKKNPVLFSDLPSESEEEPYEEQIEDERTDSQPELAYTREETRQLVQEMLDSLSEPQRICILMFYMDGASIREIAQALDCSENTVKSRLNYGRKNIRKKAEELEKKGYNFFGLAAVSLLLLLLPRDVSAMAHEPEFQEAGRKICEGVFQELPLSQKQGRPSQETGGEPAQNGRTESKVRDSAAREGSGRAAAGLLHSTAGRVLIAACAALVAGGALFGVVRGIRQSGSRTGRSETEDSWMVGSERKEAGADAWETEDWGIPSASAEETEIPGTGSEEETIPEEETVPEAERTDGTENGAESEAETGADAVVNPEEAAEEERRQEAETIRRLYEQVLRDVQSGAYEFPESEGYFEWYDYFLIDMDGDGIQELIVASVYYHYTGGFGEDVFYWRECRAFTARSSGDTWEVVPIDGEAVILEAYVPADGVGFYAETGYSRGTGDAQVDRIRIQSGILQTESLNLGLTAADDSLERFRASCPAVSWHEITDGSGLDVLTSGDTTASSAASASEGFIFPNSDTQILDTAAIAALSDADLRCAINEIYARHGYLFADEELLAYFRQFSWYQGTVSGESFDDSVFNETERENLRLLTGERDRRE